MFSYPGVFTAWAVRHGDMTPEQLVNRAADSGFKWIAQQVGDENEPPMDLIARMRAQCHQRSMKWGIWEWAPRDLSNMNLFKPNFWLLNIESDPSFNYGPLLRSFRFRWPLLPAGVVTDCAIDPNPFVVWNIKAMPEAYQQDNPVATPQNMVNRCHEMGWRRAYPVLGVYREYALSNYWLAGNGWSVYLADEMQDADWQTAKTLT